MSFHRPRGTYDAFPAGAGQNRDPHERPELWTIVEGIARDYFRRYHYDEIRTPIFEEAGLFSKSAGETSDIVVQKEMFAFTDNGERDLALRPEGTPGAIRAYVEHGLYKLAQPIKLWYMGPMFRQERQQRGRYRQHTQIGVEVLGSEDPLTDVEVIALLYDIHRAVGVRDEVVHLNNLGDMQTRSRYVPELREYLREHVSDLDPDAVARLETNPLRTFDSKSKDTQAVLTGAPLIHDFLSEDAGAHLSTVKAGLDALEIPYEVDARLVRGLDYYTSTVFEAKSSALGAQDTVGAGGRYNGLIEALGGPDISGIGWGSGVERMLLAATDRDSESRVDVYFVTLSPEARMPALRLAGALRNAGVSCDLDYGGRGAKGQFKQADRSGANFTVVIGEDELSNGALTLRDMESGDEGKIPIGAEALLKAIHA